jgi:hypothetical protein
MLTTHTLCGAASLFGAAVLAGKSPINPDLQADKPGCRTSDGLFPYADDGGSFDPEAIALMLAALDEAWASLRPAQRACASRSMMARRVLALTARGERDRARLCAYALGDVEGRDRLQFVRTENSKMIGVA